jgi:hypothetical protein
MNPPGRFSILVAVETDATRYHGENARRPRQLSHSDAEQMLAHLSADLSGLIPTINQCTIVSVGALFDQTQILRPEYPVFDALGGLLKPASGNGQESTHTPRLISLGSGQDGIPAKRLRPDAGIPIGPLQLLPLLVTGSDELVAELGQEMEHRFMEEGQVSAHTASWMETAFDISITHGRFMTLTGTQAGLSPRSSHSITGLRKVTAARSQRTSNNWRALTQTGHGSSAVMSPPWKLMPSPLNLSCLSPWEDSPRRGSG